MCSKYQQKLTFTQQIPSPDFSFCAGVCEETSIFVCLCALLVQLRDSPDVQFRLEHDRRMKATAEDREAAVSLLQVQDSAHQKQMNRDARMKDSALILTFICIMASFYQSYLFLQSLFCWSNTTKCWLICDSGDNFVRLCIWCFMIFSGNVCWCIGEMMYW